MAVDTDEAMVDAIADNVTRAVTADARDRNILRRLGAENFDFGIVAVGSDLAASALITLNLKTLGVPNIICKAHDNTYRDILEKLGADRVVIPEREAADKLAMGLTSSKVMEYIDLSEEYGIVELQTPEKWKGKTIRNLELRSKYGVNVIAVRKRGRIVIPPDIDSPLEEEAVMVILGKYEIMSEFGK